MTSPSNPEKSPFVTMLKWLDPDLEQAGIKYERIRRGLINIFLKRGCFHPEELADETFERVAKKASTLIDTYEGEPTAYFYAVARNVYLESTRHPQTVELSPAITYVETQPTFSEQEFECLTNCLNELNEEQKNLVVDYYSYEKRSKIDNRLEISRKLQISPEHLRVKAFRIRQQLQKCFKDCRSKIV